MSVHLGRDCGYLSAFSDSKNRVGIVRARRPKPSDTHTFFFSLLGMSSRFSCCGASRSALLARATIAVLARHGQNTYDTDGRVFSNEGVRECSSECNHFIKLF